MSTFSNATRAAAFAAAAGFAVSSFASPALPEDAPVSHYALAAQDLHDFHGGIHGSFATRNVKDGGFESEIEADRVNVYIGYDITRSFTVYALGGVMSVDSDDVDVDESSSAWGLGFWARLIDDDAIDFLPTISRYRLNAGVEYSSNDAADLGWSQVDGFLTFEIVNENLIDAEIFLAAVSVFAGPVFTYIDLDGYKQVSDNNWGLTVGGSLAFGRGAFVNGGVDVFSDDTCGYFTAGVRF